MINAYSHKITTILRNILMSHAPINNFTVALRLRDHKHPSSTIHHLPSHQEIVIEPHSPENQFTSRAKKFNFHHVFEHSNNQQIYSQLIAPKLNILQSNYNLMIMAYGITGSGKTYTVFGNMLNSECPEPGISIICFQEVMENVLAGYNFQFSYLQVYNESVNDLLAETKSDEESNPPKLKSLNVLEDVEGRVQMPELKKVKVSSFEQIHSLIEKGNSLRTSSATFINKLSSRSHAILQLECENPSTKIINTLTIIDLAGSEKSFHSQLNKQVKNTILKEGSNINKSLLALGNCIQSLEKGDNHIPYRDSKLTRIIKEGLSGRSNNIMIACINPIKTHYDETINTLNYASKASKIKLQVLQNQQVNDHFQCDNCLKSTPWEIVTAKMPSKYGKNPSKQPRPSAKVKDIKHFEVHKIMRQMEEEIEEQLDQLEDSHDSSTLFSENRRNHHSLKRTIGDIIKSKEMELMELISSIQQREKHEPKSNHLRLDVSLETLETEKEAMLMQEKRKEGNVRKKISIKGKENQFSRERTYSMRDTLTKTQRMKRDLDEEQKVVSTKETIMRKINKKLNQIQVSSFEPF